MSDNVAVNLVEAADAGNFLTPFGATGFSVSRLGLGTVKFGRNQNVKNACGDNFPLPDDATLARLLDICVAEGVNLIDTAPAYGSSEERLGKLIAGQRDKFVIFSKTGEEFAEGESSYNFSAEYTRQSVERSLKRLNCEFLDCVMVHCHRDDLQIITETPVLETLAGLKQAGLIRSFGVSTMSIEGGLKAAELCDAIMVSYNRGYKRELPVIERAQQLGRGVVIKKGFCSGHLNSEQTAQDCLQEILSLGEGVAVTVGTINPLHLEENIRIAKGVSLNYPKV